MEKLTRKQILERINEIFIIMKKDKEEIREYLMKEFTDDYIIKATYSDLISYLRGIVISKLEALLDESLGLELFEEIVDFSSLIGKERG